MRRIVALLFTLLLLGAARAEDDPQSAYAMAEARFLRLPSGERTLLQVLLAGAGLWTSLPSQSFSPRLFAALSAFQTSIGDPSSGMLDDKEIERLIAVTKPIFALWGFQTVSHPVRGHPIWV